MHTKRDKGQLPERVVRLLVSIIIPYIFSRKGVPTSLSSFYDTFIVIKFAVIYTAPGLLYMALLDNVTTSEGLFYIIQQP